MSAPMVALGELMATRVPSVDPLKFPEEEFELWSIPAFDAGAPELTAGKQIGSAKKIVRQNDVLISRIVPHIRRAWVVASPKENKRQIASGEWIIFRSDRVHPAYLRHVLVADAFHNQFMETVSGMGGSLLRARPEAVKLIKVPLPSLPEQRRIAAILDQADTLRRLRRNSLARVGDLGQAVFRGMFGDLRSNSQNWCTARLGDLCELVRGSSPRPQGDPRYFGGPVPRLMIADITRDGKRVSPRIDSLTLEGAKRSRPMDAGSVVMAVSGAVGLPAILAENACIHDGFVGFRDLSDALLPEFLYHYLVVQRAENSAKGTGAIWKNLTTDHVKDFVVPCPPLAEQQKFLAAIESIEAKEQEIMAHSAKVDSLFASLQHRAFCGEL